MNLSDESTIPDHPGPLAHPHHRAASPLPPRPSASGAAAPRRTAPAGPSPAGLGADPQGTGTTDAGTMG